MSDDEKPPRIVKIKLNAATSHCVMAIIPEKFKGHFIDDVVRHVLNPKGLDTREVHAGDYIKAAMVGDYKMTINGEIVTGNSQINEKYFVRKENAPDVYLEMVLFITPERGVKAKTIEY